MAGSVIKFNLIDNKKFHQQLEDVSEAVLHHMTMTGMMTIIQKPTDASISVFRTLPQSEGGKCYYPFFLREPFSLKDIDFCEFIEPEHLKLMQDKKVIPLVVMTSELWVLFNLERNRIFKNSPYFHVIDKLVKHGIHEEDVVWLTCDKYIPRDDRIKAKFIHFDYFLEQQKVLSNEFMTLENVRHKFISMAQGVHRHHRYAMTYKLYEQDLLQHGLTSCSEYENFSYPTLPQSTDQYMNILPGFDNNKFEQFKAQLPYKIDGKENMHQRRWDESHLFKDVFLMLVNETHQPDDTVFITEKTYRCINYCRPFVINGDRDSLSYIKEMGFKTFDKFWDESYDYADSDQDRVTKITEVVRDICHRSNEELLTQYNDMLPILRHNYSILKNYEQWNQLN